MCAQKLQHAELHQLSENFGRMWLEALQGDAAWDQGQDDVGSCDRCRTLKVGGAGGSDSGGSGSGGSGNGGGWQRKCFVKKGVQRERRHAHYILVTNIEQPSLVAAARGGNWRNRRI